LRSSWQRTWEFRIQKRKSGLETWWPSDDIKRNAGDSHGPVLVFNSSLLPLKQAAFCVSIMTRSLESRPGSTSTATVNAIQASASADSHELFGAN